MSIDLRTSNRPKIKLLPYYPVHSAIPFAATSQRLLSLDALRGFAAFWLIGGREFIIAIAACFNTALADHVTTQLTHPLWDGFVAWDMIMPVFLFVVGASMPLAYKNRLEKETPLGTIYQRIFRRVIILWILGILVQKYSKSPFDGLELYSNALQAIAIGCLITSIALLHSSTIWQVGLFVVFVLGYWVTLTFIPFDNNPAGTLARTANFPRYVDHLFLGNYRRNHDFTWIITSLGFSATVLMGALAGKLLISRIPEKKKLLIMILVGYISMAIGWLWSYSLPLNRHLWTSSMILWTGGLSFLFLALFHISIDIMNAKRWAYFFIITGTNALFAYVFDELIGRKINVLLSSYASLAFPSPIDDLLASTAEIAIVFLILLYFYKKHLIIRV